MSVVIITRAYFPLFPFVGLSLLVNANRVKQKIPSLLIDGDTSKRKNYNAFFKQRYRFEQFKKRNPEKANALINQLVTVLNEIDQAVQQTVT